jgi:hypothetical protein
MHGLMPFMDFASSACSGVSSLSLPSTYTLISELYAQRGHTVLMPSGNYLFHICANSFGV